eukprot:6204211-Pleurochrysis_carterae.AAC.2
MQAWRACLLSIVGLEERSARQRVPFPDECAAEQKQQRAGARGQRERARGSHGSPATVARRAAPPPYSRPRDAGCRHCQHQHAGEEKLVEDGICTTAVSVLNLDTHPAYAARLDDDIDRYGSASVARSEIRFTNA